MAMKTTILFLAWACVACGGQKPMEKPEPVSPKVLLAAKVSDAILESPDRAEEILTENDLTVESFADLMYEIAADEKMSADFKKARKR